MEAALTIPPSQLAVAAAWQFMVQFPKFMQNAASATCTMAVLIFVTAARRTRNVAVLRIHPIPLSAVTVQLFYGREEFFLSAAVKKVIIRTRTSAPRGR